ncbi:MAB_1171c family putative transporter [Streptomyces sp. NPDC047108]|uniref:MAB_1171c family putative transporter n=1 Tax=Streptomyces sp. NPDC047108 TaxID=3155025 RepID=UPI003402FF7C
MFDAVYYGAALVIGAALAFKLRGWRAAPSAQLAFSCACHAFVALAFLCATPSAYRFIGSVTGVPDLATLLVYGFITCFGASAQGLALLWTTMSSDPAETWSIAGPRAIRRIAVYALLLSAMIGLFCYAAASGHLPGGPRPLDFDTVYGDRPPVAVFLFVYQGGFAYALLGIAQACWRHADELARRDPDRVAVRTGVRLIASGCQVALGYVLCKVVAIGAAVRGRGGLDVLSTVAGPMFATIGALLMCTGFILPAVRAWQERRGAFVALRPLWLVAAEADDHILLDPVPSRLGYVFAARDLKWRLGRCMAEIRDAQLAMRIWEDPRVAGTAADLAREQGRTEEEAEAAGAAAALLGAIRARQAELRRITRDVVAGGVPVEAVGDAVADALAHGLTDRHDALPAQREPGDGPQLPAARGTSADSGRTQGSTEGPGDAASGPEQPVSAYEPEQAPATADQPPQETADQPADQRAERDRLVRISRALTSRAVTEALRRTERAEAP